eukprot:TRINITY_DN8050_c0_g1_i1.p1 TRINITY_DN8050_c0_g1~~TRINITY_DN8050_c0_g1_i1.p1  ORF type:complete len:184 (+),score=26.49 TRINITY_DN8050_c0_g1_i1:53-604(+)
MKKPKYHEDKLMRKVNLFHYNSERADRELKTVRDHGLSGREEFKKYDSLGKLIGTLVTKIKELDPKDPFRIKMTDVLLDKLYDMGLIDSKGSLHILKNLKAQDISKRRIAVRMVRLKYASKIEEAVKMLKDGHIRVGPDVIRDPAYLLTRVKEDYLTWVDSSKYKTHIAKYNETLDDFDLLNA